ncbi:hypothetical protein FACS189415_2660 [Bacteroidia bacterium]|nr:hypothetical protein FACS189415_2660 [Bacteroidia bacterium]
MNIFKLAWESKHPKKRLAAIEKIADPKKLMKIAIQASHSDVRIAAASKLFEIDHDDTNLKTIIFELGEKLKNSQDVDGRRKVAHYLHVIYMQYKNSSIGNNIRSYNGTLIYAGSKHTDGHTDEVTCTGNYDYGINFEHTNVHTDIPAEPAEYFSVE